MTNIAPSTNLQILLSREELLFVLRMLKADYVFGLDPDPIGPLTPEQDALRLAFAERALRARELAQVDAAGHLRLHNGLLNSVGACAYAQRSIIVHHFPAAGQPERLFSHSRDGMTIAHTRPDPVLHLFSSVANPPALLRQVLAFCGCQHLPETPAADIELAGEVLEKARVAGAAGDADAARQHLIGAGADADAAQTLAETLAQPHAVVIIDVLTLLPNETLAKQQITVLATAKTAWLMSEQADQSLFRLTTVTTGRLYQVLQDLWLIDPATPAIAQAAGAVPRAAA